MACSSSSVLPFVKGVQLSAIRDPDGVRHRLVEVISVLGERHHRRCRLESHLDEVVDIGPRVRLGEAAREEVVADASIMPTIPRANTNLTTVAIAELIARQMR
jgi:GMC oxidoreductase